MDSKSLDFVIVGSMKCGTTSLHKLLDQHPKISMVRGESRFFYSKFNLGVEWFERHLAERKARKGGTDLISGDEAPAYSFEIISPKIIRDTYPDAKIVWILRSPEKRSFSHYTHMLKWGRECRSFHDVLKSELFGCGNRIGLNVIRRSLYDEQVLRFLKYFPISQMHFVIFERMISEDFADEFGKLIDFLALEREEFLPRSFPHENPARVPKWPSALKTIIDLVGNRRIEERILRF